MDKKGKKQKSTKQKALPKSTDSKDGTRKTFDNELSEKASKNTVKSGKIRKLRSRTDESVRDSLNKFSSSIETSHWPEEDNDSEKPTIKISVILSRTSFLIHDYLQFKAARKIQAAYRGWLVRHNFVKRTNAAVVIQRAWRIFYASRKYFRDLENLLQQRIEEHFYRSAQKIQALWRGFWVRETIHDQYRMQRMQMRAAEDLLHCVAFKLHHLLRTYQIPGIYSLRNSTCLSKVEQLLYAMQFKQFNDRVRLARARKQHIIDEAKHTHKESGFMTEIPYGGPNFEGICEPKCCELYKEADADIKMFKILSLYARAMRDDPRIKRFRNRRAANRKLDAPHKKKRSDFCTDVVKSMRKWNIVEAHKLKIADDVFKRPENVENFLNEIQAMSNMMQARCHCNINIERLYATAK